MIALDTSTDGGTGTTSLTFSHTCTGSNLILFVAADGNQTAGGNVLTGITYNGVAMTQVTGSPIAKAGRWFYLFYLVGPATGAHNVVISNPGSDYTAGSAVSYTGALQSGQPDATNTSQANGVTHNTVTVTTIKDNCWVVAASRGTANPVADSGTTIRVVMGNACSLVDSNGPKTPAGGYTLGLTFDSTDNAFIAASFSPFPSEGLFFKLLR